jgi:hypothetical protein
MQKFRELRILYSHPMNFYKYCGENDILVPVGTCRVHHYHASIDRDYFIVTQSYALRV